LKKLPGRLFGAAGVGTPSQLIPSAAAEAAGRVRIQRLSAERKAFTTVVTLADPEPVNCT
jgi:hypothetical protein